MDSGLVAFLSSVRPGAPVDLDNLAVVPLHLPSGSADAELLEEGIAAGHTTVGEVDHAGDVNRVRVAHAGARPLLLVDGEELVGAKQNRILNASFLVGAGTRVDIPVSCVEHGRWQRRSSAFTSAARTVSPSVRIEKLANTVRSLRDTGRFDADQGAVWTTVDRLMRQHGTHSPTSAYAALADRRAAAVDEVVERLAPAEGQVGFAAIRDGRLVSLDLLGSPDLFRRGWRKLARGLVTEDLEPSASPGAAGIAAAALKLATIADYARADAPGIGATLHGRVAGLVIAAVACEGRVYHAVAGPAP